MSQLSSFSETLLSFSGLLSGTEVHLPTALGDCHLNTSVFSQIDDKSHKRNLRDNKLFFVILMLYNSYNYVYST